jgi:hypothetical protein
MRQKISLAVGVGALILGAVTLGFLFAGVEEFYRTGAVIGTCAYMFIAAVFLDKTLRK